MIINQIRMLLGWLCEKSWDILGWIFETFLCPFCVRGKQIDHLQQQLTVCEEAREEKQHLAKVAQANLEELEGGKGGVKMEDGF